MSLTIRPEFFKNRKHRGLKRKHWVSFFVPDDPSPTNFTTNRPFATKILLKLGKDYHPSLINGMKRINIVDPEILYSALNQFSFAYYMNNMFAYPLERITWEGNECSRPHH